LFEQLGGKPAPACGFAMGVERLLTLIAELRSHTPPAPDVYLVHSGVDATQLAWQVMEQLRDAGLSVVFHAGGGGFKSQMKKADASRARFAIIIGDNEAAARRVAVKSLREQADQVTLALEEAIGLIRGQRETADVEARNLKTTEL
jgi:histidyl-tRNA synthetase